MKTLSTEPEQTTSRSSSFSEYSTHNGLKACIQKKEGSHSSSQANQSPATQSNKTGLPDHLKAGVESLSGISMDDVKVHYNSSKPAQLSALAYAQGTDIHVGPGQEKHLPHETWHVVQQKQGRVKSTMQMKDGMNINDDDALEKEADEQGHRASTMSLGRMNPLPKPIQDNKVKSETIQRKPEWLKKIVRRFKRRSEYDYEEFDQPGPSTIDKAKTIAEDLSEPLVSGVKGKLKTAKHAGRSVKDKLYYQTRFGRQAKGQRSDEPDTQYLIHDADYLDEVESRGKVEYFKRRATDLIPGKRTFSSIRKIHRLRKAEEALKEPLESGPEELSGSSNPTKGIKRNAGLQLGQDIVGDIGKVITKFLGADVPGGETIIETVVEKAAEKGADALELISKKVAEKITEKVSDEFTPIKTESIEIVLRYLKKKEEDDGTGRKYVVNIINAVTSDNKNRDRFCILWENNQLKEMARELLICPRKNEKSKHHKELRKAALMDERYDT